MARFCRYCGNPVADDANFCRTCGRALTEQKPEARETGGEKSGGKRSDPREAWKAEYERIRAENRGQAARDGIRETPRDVSREPVRQLPNPTRDAFRQAPVRGFPVSDAPSFAAAAEAGEIDLGELTIPGLDTISGAAAKVYGPLGGIFRGIGSFLGGALKIFVRPGALIGTALLAGLWFALAYFRDSGSEVVDTLSFLTYAEGGADRGILGGIGGALGKGTVAAALVSLFTGGLGRAFKGIGALFTGHGERRGFFSFLFGLLAGAAVYLAFAGTYAPEDGVMAGIAGALLSLEALGGGQGKLYALAESLTSKAAGGVRTARRGKIDGLLTGLTLGFAAAAALAGLGVTEGWF